MAVGREFEWHEIFAMVWRRLYNGRLKEIQTYNPTNLLYILRSTFILFDLTYSSKLGCTLLSLSGNASSATLSPSFLNVSNASQAFPLTIDSLANSVPCR